MTAFLEWVETPVGHMIFGGVIGSVGTVVAFMLRIVYQDWRRNLLF